MKNVHGGNLYERDLCVVIRLAEPKRANFDEDQDTKRVIVSIARKSCQRHYIRISKEGEGDKSGGDPKIRQDLVIASAVFNVDLPFFETTPHPQPLGMSNSDKYSRIN